MAWRGSVSRSLLSTARASAFRSSPPVAAARLRPPPLSSSRRSFFSNRRTLGELGCVQSLLPMHNLAGVRLTSHLATNVRACCELSHACENLLIRKSWDIGIDREDREGWVMSAALPDTQMQDPDATLYLKFIHGAAHLVCEDMRSLHVWEHPV